MFFHNTAPCFLTFYNPYSLFKFKIFVLNSLFLNQARASRRPARAWFLSIVSVRMYACVCVSAPKAINN